VQKAFHSGLIANAADTLKGLGLPAEKAEGKAAAIPVASNQTGGWLNALQLQDGSYWTSHMRGTGYWRQNAEKMMAQWQPAAFLPLCKTDRRRVLEQVACGSSFTTRAVELVWKFFALPPGLVGMPVRHPLFG